MAPLPNTCIALHCIAPLWCSGDSGATAGGVAVVCCRSATHSSPWRGRCRCRQWPCDDTHRYSNWRGPVWTNANALLLFGARATCGLPGVGLHVCDAVVAVAKNLTAALAADLRDTGTWHECLSSASGRGLAAPGFLSWDTIIATLLDDVTAGHDPFAL